MHTQSFNQAREYLARVLPWPVEGEPGYINIHWSFEGKDEKGKPTNEPIWSGRAVRSVGEAISTISWAQRLPDTRDIYVCMSGQLRAEKKVGASGKPYLRAIRSQANATTLKSLFIDVDVKGGDNGYADKIEATVALNAFIAASGMPKPSAIVMSGGGMHVYWSLARALTPWEWQPLATALAEATKHFGLKCDTQCTIDSARILRVPDTLNHKTTPPQPVTLAGSVRDFDYNVERIEEALRPFIRGGEAPVLPPRQPIAGINDELMAGIDVHKAPLIDIRGVMPECGFLRDAFVTRGKDLSNPLWNLTTLLSTFTTHGRKVAHALASGHPGYTQESTDELYDRKERERQEKGLGWPSCRTISASGATQCQGCAHFSEGKSPLNFAPRPAQPPVTFNGNPIPTSAPIAKDDLPDHYTRRPDGTVCLVETDDNGEQRERPVCDYPLEEPWLQVNPHILHFTTTTERRKRQQISIELGVINTTDMRKQLQEQGMALPAGPKRMETLGNFLVNWIKKLQETKDSVASSPFGWSVKNGREEGFVFGGRLWTPTGDQAAANPDTVIARHYAPTGELNPWMDAARLITDQKRPDIEAILASAFAAPLVRFTGQPGVLMSAYSVESGIGKSTAMKIAQAVWGDPVKAVQSLSDTQNSVMNKLGEIRSLPLYWDELKTEEDTRKFVNITFQTTQGKERSRLTSSVKQREPGSWQTLLISASNDSLLDYVVQQTSTTTAGLYRIFEYPVEPANAGTPGQIEPSEASLIVAKLHDNYGNVGLRYAQFLGQNHQRVAKDVSDYLKTLGKEVNTHPDERFWLALIATICVGAGYANEIGLAKFNLEELRAFMLRGLENMRALRKSQPVDMREAINVSTILAQFFAAMRARHMLVTNRVWMGQGKPPPGAISVIGDTTRLEGIQIHYGREDKHMRISSTALTTWLKEKNYSSNIIRQAMRKEFGMRDMRGRIGSGTNYAGFTEHLLEIDLAATPLLDMIDEA